MEHIILRGKRYPLLDDVEYVYAKRFRRVLKQRDVLEDPDEDMLLLLAEAVCPKLKIERDNMSVDGKNLTFGEVKKLVIDLRDAFENILNRQLDILTESGKPTILVPNGAKAKNSAGAAEGQSSPAA